MRPASHSGSIPPPAYDSHPLPVLFFRQGRGATRRNHRQVRVGLLDWIARWTRDGRAGERVLALAWELQTAGRHEEALSAFLRAIEEAPRSASAHEGLGWCRLARAEHPEAEAAFARAAELDPDAPGPPKGIAAVGHWRYERFHEAWGLFYQGRHAEALVAFEAIVADPTLRLPANEAWKVLSGLGWCHYYLKDYRQAAGRFATILDFQKDNSYALKGLGLCRYFLGEHRQAIPLLERAAASSDSAWECLAFVGWSRYALHEWDSALEAFRRAHDANAWVAEPLYGIGWTLHGKGDDAGALDPLQRAVALLPTHPSVPDLLAEMPRHAEWQGLYVVLGRALHRTRDYAGARKVFQAAIEGRADAPELLLGLGLAQFRLGWHREALDALDRALARGAADLVVEEVLPVPGTFTEFTMRTDAATTAAWCLYHLGQPERAAERFREALSRRPDWVYLHTGLGWALLSQGKREEAEREFQVTLAANPHYGEAQRGIAEIRRWRYTVYDAAWDRFYKGETEQARGLFERILAEDPPRVPVPDLCRVRVGLAEIALAEGRAEEAARRLQEALAAEPGNALVQSRLAAISNGRKK